MILKNALLQSHRYLFASTLRHSTKSASRTMPSTTNTANQILSVYRNAVNSVKPSSLIRDSIAIDQNGVLLVEERWNQKRHKVQLTDRDVYVFGAGKAILGMCEELLVQIESHNHRPSTATPLTIKRGRLNIPHGSQINQPALLALHNITTHTGARNNIPDNDSAANTQAILEMLREAKAVESQSVPLVLGFISGGGSALLSLPKPPLTITEKQQLIHQLVRHGADIIELNTVRGALSQVKHGSLAAQICTQPNAFDLVTFIISDIIGDPIGKIASGPTVPIAEDEAQNALAIVEKCGINLEENVKKVLTCCESRETRPNLNPPLNILIGNNSIALAAAEAELKKLQFKVVNCGSNNCGEAADVVEKLIGKMKREIFNNENALEEERTYRGICWLAGGETTVNMKETERIGLGGRCQEMGLHFIAQLLQTPPNSLNVCNIYALFAGTDGQDGPTAAAGVLLQWPMLADNSIAIDEMALQEALKCHDSYNFFKANLPECLIETGVSGTNVMDIYAIVVEF